MRAEFNHNAENLLDAMGETSREPILDAAHRAYLTMQENIDNSADSDESSLYYECHVTIEPVFDEKLEEAKAIGKRFGFHVADLLMQRRKEDTPERSKFDTFMTGRDTRRPFIAIRMISLIFELKAAGFKVYRYKIEDTLLDSKSIDTLSIL